jgi:hypothetical protein
MAAVAVAGVASAQVTISGAIGMGYQNSFGTKGTTRTDGNVNFTATEDLGGGLSVTAVGGVDLQDRGQLAAGRNLSLTVAGGFGKFAMASVNAANSSRLSGAGGTMSLDKDIDDTFGADVNIQSVSYTLPAIVDGLTVAVGWSGAAGATLSNTSTSVGVVAAAPGKILSASADWALTYAFDGGNAVMTYRPNDKRARFGANLTLGGMSVGAHSVPSYTNANGDVVGDQTEFEVSMPVGAMTVGAQYATRAAWTNAGTALAKATGTTFGIKYAMSKRTSVIASFGKIDDGTADTNTTQQRVKLIHSF